MPCYTLVEYTTELSRGSASSLCSTSVLSCSAKCSCFKQCRDRRIHEVKNSKKFLKNRLLTIWFDFAIPKKKKKKCSILCNSLSLLSTKTSDWSRRGSGSNLSCQMSLVSFDNKWYMRVRSKTFPVKGLCLLSGTVKIDDCKNPIWCQGFSWQLRRRLNQLARWSSRFKMMLAI